MSDRDRREVRAPLEGDASCSPGTVPQESVGTSVPSVLAGGQGIPSGQLGMERLPRFREAMATAEAQVDFDGEFRGTPDMILARNLCRVMAEVYMLPPSVLIRIDGDFLPASMVADIFRSISGAHIGMAVEKLRGVIDTVRNPKAYMRVMLYNTVMEFEYHLLKD